jgi:hypothetical protein
MPMAGSLSSRASMARRIGSGVRNEGSPQASEAAPSTRALRIAISLIAEIATPAARAETQGPLSCLSLPISRAQLPDAVII